MIPLDVEGPVTIEVFTVARADAGLMLTGPCGPAPWLIESGGGEHPLDTAVRIIESALDDSLLVHSTSWRYERNAVVLVDAAQQHGRATHNMDVTHEQAMAMAEPVAS